MKRKKIRIRWCKRCLSLLPYEHFMWQLHNTLTMHAHDLNESTSFCGRPYRGGYNPFRTPADPR